MTEAQLELVTPSCEWERDYRSMLAECGPDEQGHSGHIGYMIRPSGRRKGYGTRILALTLERAREVGLSRVLVTCSPNNIGSARIIENNGGIKVSDGVSPETGEATSRYWTDT